MRPDTKCNFQASQDHNNQVVHRAVELHLQGNHQRNYVVHRAGDLQIVVHQAVDLQGNLEDYDVVNHVMDLQPHR